MASNVFTELYSLWEIEDAGEGRCKIRYKIRLQFASPMYAAITKQFFDVLASSAT